MLAAGYISNGVARLRHPEAAAASISPLLAQARKRVEVPLDATTLARATGAAQVAAGNPIEELFPPKGEWKAKFEEWKSSR